MPTGTVVALVIALSLLAALAWGLYRVFYADVRDANRADDQEQE